MGDICNDLFDLMIFRIETADVSEVAEENFTSREEIIKMALNHCKRLEGCRTLPLECALYAHDVLQRTKQGLERIGCISVNYRVCMTNDSEFGFLGVFGVWLEGARLKILCDNDILPAPPYGSTNIRDYNRKTLDDYDIFYWCDGDNENLDIMESYFALRKMDDWTKEINELDVDGVIAAAAYLGIDT